LKVHPKLTRKEIAEKLKDISEDGVKYHLAKLVKQGSLMRVGSTKAGYWQVL
jgi:ATP-dependent DNA helicase RecG